MKLYTLIAGATVLTALLAAEMPLVAVCFALSYGILLTALEWAQNAEKGGTYAKSDC